MAPLPEPTPRSSWPDDEHATCPPPCGGLMSVTSSGELRCDECGLRAADASVRQEVQW
ncbi:tRNA(Ile2) C34 agmatinyltransferase TiaS [Actinoplanes campanulatus]|uniref:tRNA(Ile2) C34 agmatinyltransferase TiaS n=1 Tax=Actinoplanes campanulatus TaxID=113559 RepID=A0A7W5AMK8_9ACTN|nr:hypothetical protein [Actinoplanes campanulatus]MBB3099058.1 tRNA(Ile2) C34 agmatinyltransferase TiaS [Actinoplanes campanulatus]